MSVRSEEEIAKDDSAPAGTAEAPAASAMTGRAVEAVFWSLAGGAARNVSRLVVLAVLARLLSPLEFGLVAAATTMVVFFDDFAELGIGPAIIQRATLEMRHIRTGFTTTVALSLLFAAAIALGADLLARFYQSPELVPVLVALAWILPLGALAVIPEALLRRDLRLRQLAQVELIAYVVGQGGVGITMAAAGLGVWSLVGGTLAREGLKAGLLLYRRPFPLWPQFQWQAFRELFSFGSGSMLSGIFNYLAVQGDNLIVGRWLGLAPLGLYTRAFSLMTSSTRLITTQANQVLFPAMARVQSEPERLQQAYRRSAAVLALIALPATAVLFVLAPEVIRVLLGPGWAQAIWPFRVLVLGLFFRFGYQASNSLLQARGDIYAVAWRQAIYAALVLSGAWVGQNWGLTGVAAGVLLAVAVHYALAIQLTLRLVALPWREFVRLHVPAVLAALTLGLAVLGAVIVLRYLGASLAVTLAAAGGTAGLLYLALWRLYPQRMLGPEGAWLVEAGVKFAVKKLKIPKRVAAWVLGAQQP
jgi:PST family polysaccharide transporter